MIQIVKDFVADKRFYVTTGKVMIPIVIQLMISSMSGLIDAAMASRFDAVGEMGIALQIDNLMQYMTFGITSGINIFIVQFFAAKKFSQMKRSFGLCVLSSLCCASFWVFIALFFNTRLLSVFIQDPVMVEQSFQYLRFSCYSFFFTSVMMCFTYAYHSIQKTKIPLFISLIGLIFHVFLNYILMFACDLRLAGAGLSLTITQMVSLLIFVIYTRRTKQPFVGSWQEMFIFPRNLVKKVVKKVYLLVINATFVGLGNCMYIVFYGTFGKSMLDCYYIGEQVLNPFYTFVYAMQSAAASLIGLELGRAHYQFVRKQVLYFFGITCVFAVMIVTIVLNAAPYLVRFFAISDSNLFTFTVLLVRVMTVRIAFKFFNVVIFSSLKSGGDVLYLAFLDSVILWIVGISVTFIAIKCFHLNNLLLVILLSQSEQLVRMGLGLRRIKSKKWVKRMI